MKIEIDGSKITTHEDLHKVLAEALELPEHYGRNLDALWDCLTGWVDTPIVIVWNHYATTVAVLGEHAENAAKVFDNAVKEVPGIEFRRE
jgi:ribonuclease inhibitor